MAVRIETHGHSGREKQNKKTALKQEQSSRKTVAVMIETHGHSGREKQKKR